MTGMERGPFYALLACYVIISGAVLLVICWYL